MNTKNYTDRDWEELASAFSEENGSHSNLPDRFKAEDHLDTEKQWKSLREMSDNREINVDMAWNKVNSRLNQSGTFTRRAPSGILVNNSTFLRIAAAALILLSLGTAALMITNPDALSKRILVATTGDQKNFKLTLPDGSNVYMNRNTQLSYSANFGKHGRNVALSGEAFFEITGDASNPFTIDAGKANVKVIGTSFNVITKNSDSAVEVFVKTGKVLLSGNAGNQSLTLEPGYIGTMDSDASVKTLNNNPNYMAWNTGLLVYTGQTLDIVFKDLRRVYDMIIVADDPDILKETWTSSVDKQSTETIIRLICASFNLGYSKEGDVFHLAKK
ncbi:MAG: FecR domain-containing protein [Bacteroidales bacterium]|nr:FecR domain-containing protein [Bacteroidales bacterium]